MRAPSSRLMSSEARSSLGYTPEVRCCLAVCLALSALACSPETQMNIRPPETEGQAQSAVFVALRDSEISGNIVALDAPQTGPMLELSLSDAEEALLVAVYFDASVADLGLSPGGLPESLELPADLPPFAYAYESRIGGLQLSDWEPTLDLPPKIDALLYPGRSQPVGCTEFDGIHLELDTNDQVAGLVGQEDGAALLFTSGTRDGKRIYRIDLTGDVTRVEQSFGSYLADLGPGSIETVVQGSDGAYWIGRHGRLFTGTPGGGFLSVRTSTASRPSTHWMTVAPDDPGRLFTMGPGGVIHRYRRDRDEWDEIGQLALSGAGCFTCPALAWHENVLYALGDREGFQVGRFDGRRFTVETLAKIPETGVISGIGDTHLGPAVVSFDVLQGSGLQVRQEDRWVPIAGLGQRLAFAVTRYGEDGFLVGGNLGFILEYRNDRFCAEHAGIAGSQFVQRIAPAGRGFVTVGMEASEEAQTVTVIVPR